MKKLLALTVAVIIASCAFAFAENETLVLYHLQEVPAIRSAIQNSADRFMQDEGGNVFVEVNYLTNDVYKRRIAIAAALNSLPDIFATWGGATLSDYARLGKAMPLTEYMAESGYASRFLPAAIDQVTFEGEIWGVPVENVALGVVFYNKTLFAQLGIQPPETMDELYTVIETLNENGVVPFALANRSAWPSSMYYMYLVDRLGARQAFMDAADRKSDGSPVSGAGFADERLIEAWELLIDLIDKGAFPKDVNSMDDDSGDAREMFYQGRAGMYLMGSWTISYVLDENPDFFDDLDFFEFPTLEVKTGGFIGTVGDNFYSISSGCANPDLAFEMIRYLIDEQAVSLRLDAGRFPPVNDVTLGNPLTDKIRDFIQNASYVQLWYDQWLPTKLAEIHKDTCRAIFAKTMTAYDAAVALEKAAVEYYAE